MTTRPMPRFDFYEPGFFCFALVLCIRAAHVKFASGWGVGGVWDIAFYGDALALIVGIGDGDGMIGELPCRGEGDFDRGVRMW